MMSYTLFYCSNINSYFFLQLDNLHKKQQEYRFLPISDTPVVFLEAVLISFDKFVKHDLDECNLYHSFCGFSKEFIIDGQPSEVFQP